MGEKEKNEIADTLYMLEHGSYRERKPYLDALRKGKVVTIGNYGYSEDTWCWLVWKETELDSGTKGEPVVKVIPKAHNLPKVSIRIMLTLESWQYL